MPSNRVENRGQLQTLLRELFQFDASELDFGVYRVLNQRRDRIEQFIEGDLLEAVDESLESIAQTRRAEIQRKMESTRDAIIEEFGSDALGPDGSLNEPYDSIDHEALSRYRQLQKRLNSVEVAEETEARIFNDLYRFFSRYYDNGDFHTKRRISSRDSKYYVPYNGEETHFHWANRDQYYVKTSEHFVDYRFDAGEILVQFQLEEAIVPQDNVKDDERYFVLGQGNPVSSNLKQQELTINFQYRQITEEEADEIVGRYNDATGDDRSSFAHMNPDMRCDALEGWILDNVEDSAVKRTLSKPASENGDDTSRLKRHLRRYVSENTMDYFVHKDLGGFLNGELEFFLQNEVLDVDDLIETEDASHPDVLRARTVKEIAERIIRFLAQIEDFQKRLFEKKKFIVETDYCVTLDRVPEELYEEIIDNEEQIDDWKDTYGFEEDVPGLRQFVDNSIDVDFLRDHQHMMVDTRHFDDEFTRHLLSSFSDIDEEMSGCLVKGENFQALNLLAKKYRNNVHSVYIDPPYNTGGRDFLYKDKYQHSSWLSMVTDRVDVSKTFMSDNALFFSSIDDNELHNYIQVLDDSLGERLNIVTIRNNPKGRGLDKYLARSHDYLLCYALGPTEISGLPKSDEQIEEQYGREDENGRFRLQPLRNTHRQFNRDTRPNLWFPLYVDPESKEVHLDPSDDREEVYPVWSDGWEGCWTWSEEKVEEERDLLVGQQSSGRWKIYRKDYAVDGDAEATYTPKTIWDDNDLRTDYAQRVLDDIMGEQAFRSPKPPALIEKAVQLSTGEGDYILDFFAGSGTTAQSAIDLIREGKENARYILVDMGDHLTETAKSRIQKVVYSDDWDEGVPQNQNGLTHSFKYHSIESFEDALNNITLVGDQGPQATITDQVTDYIEGYLLDFESKESPTLLPGGTFEEPFDHELLIEMGGTSREPQAVDLVETFHYLLGAHVRQYFYETHQGRRYVVTDCEVDSGTTTERILTTWRRTEDLDLETEADWFDDEFDAESYDRVYVNGESFIAQSEPLEITFREQMEVPPHVA